MTLLGLDAVRFPISDTHPPPTAALTRTHQKIASVSHAKITSPFVTNSADETSASPMASLGLQNLIQAVKVKRNFAKRNFASCMVQDISKEQISIRRYSYETKALKHLTQDMCKLLTGTLSETNKVIDGEQTRLMKNFTYWAQVQAKLHSVNSNERHEDLDSFDLKTSFEQILDRAIRHYKPHTTIMSTNSYYKETPVVSRSSASLPVLGMESMMCCKSMFNEKEFNLKIYSSRREPRKSWRSMWKRSTNIFREMEVLRGIFHSIAFIQHVPVGEQSACAVTA